MSYKFDTEDAERRLNATKEAQELVEQALRKLQDAGVRNAKVRNALDDSICALAKFRSTTKFAITKRRERGKQCRPSIS